MRECVAMFSCAVLFACAAGSNDGGVGAPDASQRNPADAAQRTSADAAQSDASMADAAIMVSIDAPQPDAGLSASDAAIADCEGALTTSDQTALSPRDNADAEILALKLSQQVVASQPLYDRVVADLSVIRSSQDAPTVGPRPLFRTNTLQVALEGPEVQSVLDESPADGSDIYEFLRERYPYWNCLNDLYKVTTIRVGARRLDLDGNIENVSYDLTFDGRYHGRILEQEYEPLLGVTISNGSSTPTADVSDVCLVRDGEVHTYVFDAASGTGCSSGACALHTYWGYTTTASGQMQFLGKHARVTFSSNPLPEWLAAARDCTDQLVSGFFLYWNAAQ